MHATGGKAVYEALRSLGVRCIFGMEDPVHVLHAVDRDVTRIITVRDEKHGAIMAHGYAQITHRPGVCTATFGPGAANLIPGLLEALRSSVPVVALVQDHPLAVKGRHASSELDHAAALGPFTKAVLRIDSADRAAGRVRDAFRLAIGGRPGPVALLCPTDVMAADATLEPPGPVSPAVFPASRPRADRSALEAAAALLCTARRPFIVAGGGCQISGAAAQVIALAERFCAPIATTLTGRGLVPDSHPLAAGPIGVATGGQLGRGRAGNEMLAQADVVVIAGSRTGQLAFSDWTLPGSDAAVIHLDIDPVETGRNFRTAVSLVGDARETLTELLAHCEGHAIASGDPTSRDELKVHLDEWRERLAPMAASAQQPMRPERVLAAIDGKIDASTLIVADASFSTGWSASQLSVPKSGRFLLSPRGTGGIGWSLPAGIGAKLADESRTVICITGDGAFGYVLNELETAARYAVKVLVVVFNNSTLAFQRHWERHLMGRYLECDFLDVDYSEVGRALKCAGERVTDPNDIDAALERGLASAVPYVIDAVIDPEAIGPIKGLDDGQVADADYH